MTENKRPYLVVATLVEQPTWGGRYIVQTKDWGNRDELAGRKIGQSYELFGQTQLYTTLTSTKEKEFAYILKGMGEKNFLQPTIPVSLFSEGRVFPLIKFTQAVGNSFQLHIKPSVANKRWRPKAESWYYFEKGCLTFGIREGTDLDAYKQTCFQIEQFMKDVVEKIREKGAEQERIGKEIQDYIQLKNPWQYVNKHYVEKDTLVDLSSGGIHHSWEKDEERCPRGNVLYEVQEDVEDDLCTIRAFDQGKILREGGVRPIHIDDYFSFIDTDPKHNKLNPLQAWGNTLLNTKHYCLDVVFVKDSQHRKAELSFHHLFVRNGALIISGGGVGLYVGEGHSCFVPSGCAYTIKSVIGESRVLVTYIN